MKADKASKRFFTMINLDENKEKSSRPLSFLEAQRYLFSPGNIFWKRKNHKTRLVRKNQLIDHNYLEKFYKRSLEIVMEDNSPPSSAYLTLHEGLSGLILCEFAPDKELFRTQIINALQMSLWSGEESIELRELIDAFYSGLCFTEQTELKQLKKVCGPVFIHTAFRASFACSLAIICGFSDGEFLRSLYLIHFKIFNQLTSNFSSHHQKIILGDELMSEKRRSLFYGQLQEGLLLHSFKRLEVSLMNALSPDNLRNNDELQEILSVSFYSIFNWESAQMIFEDQSDSIPDKNLKGELKTFFQKFGKENRRLAYLVMSEMSKRQNNNFKEAIGA